MNPIKLNKRNELTAEEKEKFFQQLESNEVFFKETFEAILTLIISDSKLIVQVSNLIETNYRNLYLAILKTQEKIHTNDSPSCCQTSNK